MVILRCEVLEDMGKGTVSSINRGTNAIPIERHRQSSDSARIATAPGYQCYLCKRDHSIVSCGAFLASHRYQRATKATQLEICKKYFKGSREINHSAGIKFT